jgi:hypothetical protein
VLTFGGNAPSSLAFHHRWRRRHHLLQPGRRRRGRPDHDGWGTINWPAP